MLKHVQKPSRPSSAGTVPPLPRIESTSSVCRLEGSPKQRPRGLTIRDTNGTDSRPVEDLVS